MKPARPIVPTWSRDLAYAVGLVASDGNLRRDGRHVILRSIDRELIEKYQLVLGVTNTIGVTVPKRPNRKTLYHLCTAQVSWFTFLNRIGLFPAKSKTIAALRIPDRFFAAFLRGVFDGDGTFYTARDIRYPKATVCYIEIASASREFIEWLRDKTSILFGVRGIIRRGKGVLVLRFFKNDSRTIARKMYMKAGGLFLRRKYDKIATGLEISLPR